MPFTALQVLGLFTALLLVGAAISAGLAFYFVRNADYKDGEASAMFAAIFSAGAFLLFLIYLVKAHSAITSLQESLASGARRFATAVEPKAKAQ